MELTNKLSSFASQIESKLDNKYEEHYDLEKQHNAGNLDLIVVVNEDFEEYKSILSVIRESVRSNGDVRTVAEKNNIEDSDDQDETSFSGRESVSDLAREYSNRTEFYIREF